MRVLVLGSAAGGGVPQWNCRAPNSAAARRGFGRVLPRTQSSLAVSPDGRCWMLLNASPDLRAQINAHSRLWPRDNGPVRNSPIEAVVLTNADVDHIAGLISLREGHRFAIYATQRVLSVLAANPIFNVLDPEKVQRVPMTLGEPQSLLGSLAVTPFAVPGKIALFLEDTNTEGYGTKEGDTVGLEVSDGKSRFHYIPGCTQIDSALKQRLMGSPLTFFDGTLFTDDEMVKAGLSSKTGARMGHISMSGPTGSMAGLAQVNINRRVYVHINNSNPVLAEDSPERALVEKAKWEIAFDGMEIEL